jgi:hypothetical protein
MKKLQYVDIEVVTSFAFDETMQLLCTNITIVNVSLFDDAKRYFGAGLFLTITNIANIYIDGTMKLNTSLTQNIGE